MAPEIVLPTSSAPEAANRLLARHQDWLRRKLRWAKEVEEQATRLGLNRPGIVWLEGHAQLAPMKPGPSEDAGSEALERWYRGQARTALTEATEQLADRLVDSGLINRRPGRISIRDPRSRWGSCSSRGNLSYSWRLVMMPRQVLEYVVCHELCHLEVLDHSPRFWRLMDAARPRWSDEASWLRLYGQLISLHRPRAAVDNVPPPLPPSLPRVEPNGFLPSR